MWPLCMTCGLGLLFFEMLAAANQLMELRYHQLEKELRDNDENNFFIPINNSTQRFEKPKQSVALTYDIITLFTKS